MSSTARRLPDLSKEEEHNSNEPGDLFCTLSIALALPLLAGRALSVDEATATDESAAEADAYRKYAKETAERHEIRLKSDGFVEATDPNAFLMIEARAAARGRYEWHYGFARMDSVRLRLLRGDEVLWDAPTLSWSEVLDRPDQPYTALLVR